MTPPSARKNLWRARFFLQHVEQVQRQQQLRFEEFAAYLSAFLSCARYVTDMFERSKKKGHQERHDWWKKHKASLSQEDRAFLNFMTDQRDLEQHEEGAQTQPGIAYVSVFKLPTDRSMHPYGGGFTYFGPPGAPPPKVGRMVHKWQRGGRAHDVIEDCRRYLALLERVVNEFEAGHRA
jgi:hypothetical protein